jgi:hypothetical protein
MGWTSFHINQPVKEWFKQEWNEKMVALDIAIVKRNTLYAAIKNTVTGEVFCAVFLLRWSRDYYNFSYKDMTEFVGPNESECPERILKLLTPLTDQNDPNGYARDWRKRCEKNITNRKKLNTGNYVIKTSEPLEYTNGGKYQYFKHFNRRWYAGIMERNEFSVRSRVSFNPKYYQYELVECKREITVL